MECQKIYEWQTGLKHKAVAYCMTLQKNFNGGNQPMRHQAIRPISIRDSKPESPKYEAIFYQSIAMFSSHLKTDPPCTLQKLTVQTWRTGNIGHCSTYQGEEPNRVPSEYSSDAKINSGLTLTSSLAFTLRSADRDVVTDKQFTTPCNCAH